MQLLKSFPLLILLVHGWCMAQERPNEADWNLRLEKDGVLVFTRPMPGNPADEFLALTLIDGDIDSAFAIIANPVRFLAADPHSLNATLLKQVDTNECYVWNEVKMPAILKKRDMVSRVHTSKTSKGYMMVAECTPDFVAEKPGFVRVQKGNIIVGLRASGPNQFELMYRGYVYPTSPLTIKFVNKMIVPSTFDRIEGVRKLLKQELAQ